MTCSSDIMAEWSAGSSLSQVELDWLVRQGVPPMALARPLALGTDLVVFHSAGFEFGRYRASEEAESAVIFPGFDEWANLVDLIAWRPKSGALASWLGRIGLLGAENLHLPRLGMPIAVHESPLDWLRAERQGCVVVDPARAATLLRDAEPLSVRSAALGTKLRGLLHRPPPKIVIRRAA